MTLVDDITYVGEIHPAAEAWPLLPDDELAELAASIAEIGLQDPITLDPAGRLLDGRNRLNACREVDVEPEFVVYDGDPVPFILAKNSDRRHMTTGARAMATAVNLRDAGHRKNGRWTYGALESDGSVGSESMKARIRQAGLVLDHADDLASLVIDDEMKLDAAYQRAREAKAKKESEESRLAALHESAPDLAEKVDKGELKLGEAEAAKKQRDEESDQKLKIAISCNERLASSWAWLGHLAAGTVERQDDSLAALNDTDRTLVDEAINTYRKANQ